MDTALFYFINHRLSNPLFDMFMPFFTDRWYLFGLPFLAYCFYKDWRRALLSVVFVFVAIGIADLAGNQIKHLLGRIRPCRELSGVNLLKGCGNSYSLPSNHAANAFAAMSTLFFIWRGRVALGLWFIAAAVAFSRVYLGVHYPVDVLAGAILGSAVGYGVARFEPVFIRQMKKHPERTFLACVLLVITAIRVLFVLFGPFDLAGDEAHYWEWSRRLDWSYYSKGPVIAWLIRALTTVGGNTELAIRSGAMICSALLSVFLYITTTEMFGSKRAALLAALIPQAVPMFATYGIIMSIDSPFILFWCIALLLFYRAVSSGRSAEWYMLGVVIGLGLLTKYTMGLFFFGALYFLATSRKDRFWLTRKEPWLALVISVAVFSPVIFWNSANDWVTFHHTAGHLKEGEGFSISIKYFFDFLGSQAAVISPILFILLLTVAFQRKSKAEENENEKENEKRILFCFSVPILIFFALKSLLGKVQGNWAMEAYPALFILLGAYLDRTWIKSKFVRVVTIAAFVMSLIMVGALHSPALVHRFVERFAIIDKLIGLQDLANRVDALIDDMPDRKKTFVFASRYMTASELAFYMKGHPVTFHAPGIRRMSQYDLWPGLETMVGYDAVFVTIFDREMPDYLVERFQKVERVPFKIIRYKKVIQSFTLFKCYGFKGIKPQEATLF